MTGADRTQAAARNRAAMLASLLLAAGVVVAATPVLPVVHPADGAAVSAYAIAGWAAVLPGLLALILAVVRPVLGVAATAGAGLIGIARLLADLAVVAETDRVSRPELFVETTDRARPFAAAAGGWVLLGADLLMIVVGVLAARRLAAEVGERDERRGDALFGGPPPDPVSAAEADPGVPAAALEPPPGRRRLNLPMLGVGFLGAVLLLVGNLDIPYQGGYLALRVLPFGTSVSGLAAAVVLSVIAAGAVLVAAALPRDVAQALLGGTALAAAVPSLTAVVAVVAGAPTGLSAVVWWALAGAALLAAAGLLARRAVGRSGGSDALASPATPTLIAAICALAAAAALGAASQTSLLYLDGAPPDEVSGVLLAPAALPLLIAAIPVGLAAVLALVPATAVLGRTGLMIVWAGAGYALGRAFWATSLVSATSSGSTTGITHTWTIGPGGWLMSVGAALAVAAAVLAVTGHRRAEQASPEVVDDDSLAASRAARRWIAIAGSVAVPVALALPVYSGLGVSSAPSLLHGLDLDTWAFWALAVGGWLGLWLGATTRSALVAATAPVAAATVLAQPLLVPGVVRGLPGFTLAAGFWAIVVLVIVLLGVAAVDARSAAGVRTRSPWPAGGADGRPQPDRVEPKGSRG
ncbi:MAG TPA: hypothetical protein PKY70_13605 [Nakamurella multipartita]|nr:hypothetical protein [Nakamurella multipartita]